MISHDEWYALCNERDAIIELLREARKELRVVQFYERTPVLGRVCSGLVTDTRWILQYRDVDWGKWKDIPVVRCEEGSEPSED